MPRSKRVWLLLDSSTFGGIETHVLELAKGLIAFKQNVKVVFLTSHKPTPPLIAQLQTANIDTTILDVDYPQHSIWLRLNKAIDKAASQNQKPTVIHAHGYKANILLRLSRLCGATSAINIVSTFHAGETPIGKVRWYDAVDRVSAIVSHKRICVSRAIQGKVPYSSVLVNNFVPQTEFLESTNQNVAFVGRLSPEKGPDTFLDIANRFPRNAFHVYGSGDMELELKQHNSPNVTFHGHQKEMARVWPDIDVLLITSKYEGLPMAALEAMSRGIPLISFKLGELPSMIDSGINGWIVDSNQEMYDALKHWFSLSPAEKAQVKLNAQQTIEQNYSTKVIIPQVLSIYGFGDAVTQ